MSEFVPLGLGWHPDVPDMRDLTINCDTVRSLLDRLPKSPVPGGECHEVDLREFFPAVRDQGRLRASCAHACLGMYQYFERRTLGRTGQPSHLFLHRMIRKLMRVTGNVDTNLRTAMKALARFGVPPEAYWPYDCDNLDAEPDPFLYAFSSDCRAMIYMRLDRPRSKGAAVLRRVRAMLRAGFPVAFGFAVPSSLTAEGIIPYRPRYDAVQGGQAVVAVGYDDDRSRNPRGALLVRSSWGEQWGEAGYGWLPYAYVEKRMALDFWTMLRPDWLESGELFRPLSEQ